MDVLVIVGALGVIVTVCVIPAQGAVTVPGARVVVRVCDIVSNIAITQSDL